MCSATRRQTVAWSLVLPLDKWLRLYRNAALAPILEMRKDITLNCKISVAHPPHHLCLKCERLSLLVKLLKNHVVLAASWILQHLNIGLSGSRRTQQVTLTWWMRPWVRVFCYIIGYHRQVRPKHLCPLDETRVLAKLHMTLRTMLLHTYLRHNLYQRAGNFYDWNFETVIN